MSVAVLMTCFNEGPYIEAAVRSVLDQTRADAVDRIVVMDDGSQEPTREVLRRIEGWDARIDVAYGPGGYGLPKNRNLAAERAPASPFLAILDGDDLWAPDKLARQLDLLDARPQVGLVYTGYATFMDGADPAGALPAHVRDLHGAADLALAYFLNDPPIMPSSVLMRREAFEAAGRFDPTVRVFEDTEFYLRLAGVTRFAAIDEPLLLKRNRAASLTGRRQELLAHHAFVAFKAAAREPRLLPLVPRRLAERARKLGNLAYYEGRVDEARRLWGLALQLHPTSAGAAASWLLAAAGGERARGLLSRRLASRAAAHNR